MITPEMIIDRLGKYLGNPLSQDLYRGYRLQNICAVELNYMSLQ